MKRTCRLRVNGGSEDAGGRDQDPIGTTKASVFAAGAILDADGITEPAFRLSSNARRQNRTR